MRKMVHNNEVTLRCECENSVNVKWVGVTVPKVSCGRCGRVMSRSEIIGSYMRDEGHTIMECNTWQCRVNEYSVYDDRNAICPGCGTVGIRYNGEDG